MPQPDRQNRHYPACCNPGLALLAGLLVAYRWYVLHAFSFRYTDEDQALMWFAAREFAHGIFSEPCFYGQSYNTMLEGLLAVPLTWLDVPLHMALPVTTTLLALCPFFLIAEAARRTGRPTAAAAALALPLMLPVQYSIITSAPRGFVTGICAGTIGLLLLGRKGKPAAALPGGYLLAAACSLNPNSLIITLPGAACVILRNYCKAAFWKWSLAGLAAGAVQHWQMHAFYARNPEYALFKLHDMSFSWARMVAGLKTADRWFSDITPLIHSAWFLAVLLAAIAAGFACRRRLRECTFTLAAAAGLCLCLGFYKVSDSDGSVLYSYSRFFLAVPVLLCCLLLQLEKRTPSPGKWRLMIIAVITACAILIMIRNIAALSTHSAEYAKSRSVSVIATASVLEHSARLKAIADRAQADLVVFSFPLHTLCYAFSARCYDTCPTLFTGLERRTRRYLAERSAVRKKIMLVTFSNKRIQCRFIDPHGAPTLTALGIYGIEVRK